MLMLAALLCAKEAVAHGGFADLSVYDRAEGVSVDGVNGVSGETANPAQTGYVLPGRQSYDILGWRKSLAETAAFYFTALPDSYAARTGRLDSLRASHGVASGRLPRPFPGFAPDPRG